MNIEEIRKGAPQWAKAYYPMRYFIVYLVFKDYEWMTFVGGCWICCNFNEDKIKPL